MSLPPGIYQHNKGNHYPVPGVAKHSATDEECVVYQTLYGDLSLWVRPLTLFMENVQVDKPQIARFAFIESSD